MKERGKDESIYEQADNYLYMESIRKRKRICNTFGQEWEWATWYDTIHSVSLSDPFMNTGVRLPRKCNRYHDERRVELKVKGKKKLL